MNARTLCRLLLVLPIGVLIGGQTLRAQDSPEQTAQQIIEVSGVRGGFIVHLPSGDGALTAALRANERYQVHGLDRDAGNVTAARQRLVEQGINGPVSVAVLEGKQLPYCDQLVNLIVAEDLDGIDPDEAMRVLVPQGVLLVRENGAWQKTVKPASDQVDDWTHYLHDPTGNAVSHDELVGPPRHLQWVGSPRWSRHHDRMASMSALVSAGGRMFYVMDEGSRVSIQLPPKWTLIARDAYNGTILWKRPIENWQSHLWPLKSGPTQLARRLVADSDTVFATLGFEAPLTAIDAVTGETLRTYPESQSTEEILHDGGQLFLLVNENRSQLSDYVPQFNVGDQGRVAGEYTWNAQPRKIAAYDADSGQLLWAKKTLVAPLSLTSARGHILYHNGQEIVCLNHETGEEVWTVPATRRKDLQMNFGPRLLVYQDVVLFAGGDRKMNAYQLETGKELWSAAHERSGYQSPEDLLVAGGLVWNAPTTSGRDSGELTGRDPWTGEIKKRFAPNVETYWFHHRCYIAKATDRFMMPSRTGIEFVDFDREDWDIHHWVRGGCLYGVMPCNGMVYAPPHNCACYPEAKLYGFSALAPASRSRRVPQNVPERGRLEQGPAYDREIAASDTSGDWPTYRHDAQRSGYTTESVAADVAPVWTSQLGGPLSSVTVADGKVFVAQVDAHTLHALDADSGETAWTYVAGGRIDSPPTVSEGRAVFGCADGWVYCLSARDGELIWRYRGAPVDRRTMAFEQLESLWPVHGSVLVQDGAVYCVAGRSNFLDGGLRFLKLDLTTGNRIVEKVIDDTDPETGGDLQDRLQTLQMPAGLSDILSSDGPNIYMRSQRFDQDGNRYDIGPNSGNAAENASVQGGEYAHVFAPMGFLDSSWFHRSYWVYGRSFSGGHNGYYQAAKYAPAGRILVHDDEKVYSFGRKPEYLKWTTVLEHQLFATNKEAPSVPAQNSRTGRAPQQSPFVGFAKSKSLDPTQQAVTVEAWVKADRPDGVVVSRGGPARGYALVLRGGKARFVLREAGKVSHVAAPEPTVKRWVHLVGMVTPEKTMKVFVDGELVASAEAHSLITGDPAQQLEIGGDDGGSVGEYPSPLAFTGLIDEVRVYHGALSNEEVAAHFENVGSTTAESARLVLACSFDKGTAQDLSGNDNRGTLGEVEPAEGKSGQALKFSGRARGNANRGASSFVERDWKQDLPIFVQAMVKADDTLFMMGAPDIVDEEDSFQRLMARDPQVQDLLAKQDRALEGAQGALLLAIDAESGERLAAHELAALPVWDALAAARGRLYVATQDGEVICFGK